MNEFNRVWADGEAVLTSIAAWIAVDSRKPSAIYFVSDSRITWGTPQARWDGGRKLFASKWSADIFAYCGAAFVPLTALGQLVELIDRGLLFANGAAATVRHENALHHLAQSLASRRGEIEHPFQILHASREGENMNAEFSLWESSFAKGTDHISDIRVPVPHTRSSLIIARGTGALTVKTFNERWHASAQGGTSRAILSAFCDAVTSQIDPMTGGAPQLVGIPRSGPARSYGVAYRGKRYLNGMNVSSAEGSDGVEWRDELFQRIDGYTLSLLPKAQRHARPKFRNG